MICGQCAHPPLLLFSYVSLTAIIRAFQMRMECMTARVRGVMDIVVVN